MLSYMLVILRTAEAPSSNKFLWLGVGAWLDGAGSLGATHTEAECSSSIWVQTKEPHQVLLLQQFAYNVWGIACGVCSFPEQHRLSAAHSVYADHAFALCLCADLFDFPANPTVSASNSSICFTLSMSAGA